MAKDKILIVDNEMEIIQLIRMILSREGYQIVWTTDSSKAADLVRTENPDLILLDVVMPGLSGIEVCGQIREFSTAPILFVSCKDQEMDKVLGLTIGGDDYITKPFSPAELVARVKAHLRRSNLSGRGEPADAARETIRAGDLSIHPAERTVSAAGREIRLTATEFDLLLIMAREPNRVFTARQLFHALWRDAEEDEDVRTIMVHISNIRKKLGSPANTYIKTVRGVGYKLVK
ncbi:MAG: response regulator transcription factor [Anaerovoracaceae bacterium]|jgi:DNA-binding response OmpR family regulator